MIEETKIKEKLKKFLNREPTENEVMNGFKDQNIVNEIIVEQMEDLNTKVILLREELLKLKK